MEVQIFRDSHGHVAHLFEHDCPLRRRHQRIIEEAPNIPERLRGKLHTAAVAAAEAIGYLGAGTVEFLVEPNGAFYFLEINTRLRVEHPVTEMITGQDLVQWQLLVAAGEPLPLSQDELHCCGPAIEARISAEDPGTKLSTVIRRQSVSGEPQSGDDIRVDSGVRQGDDISPWYDPILAKLIVQGHDRTEAITHLRGALAGYQIAGVTVNIGFLRRLAADPAFHMATHTTRYVDARLTMLTEQQVLQDEVFALLALYRLLGACRIIRI